MRQLTTRTFCLTLLNLLFNVFTAKAQNTFTVTNTNSSGPGCLLWAIDSANIKADQDTIVFKGISYPNVIVLSVSIDNNLVIIGPGSDSLSISGNNTLRIFTINDTTWMSGITLINGSGSYGGGVFNESVLFQTNCTITECRASYGGGIFNNGELSQNNCTLIRNRSNQGAGCYNHGVFRQTNCTISNNKTNLSLSGYGGGVFNDSVLIQDHCILSWNESSDGGGIYNTKVLTQIDCTISKNKNNPSGGGIGGGIKNVRGVVTQTNCVISNNTTVSNGGGIYSDFGSLIQNNCTISGNNTDEGGGLYISYSNVVQTNCIISGNTARLGGGICTLDGELSQKRCSFLGNKATEDGGGILNRYALIFQKNCTITGNTSNLHGGGIFNDGNLIQDSCILSRDTSERGGGVYNSDTIIQTNCTLSENHAYFGGGLFSSWAVASLNGCNIEKNSAYQGGGVHSDGGIFDLFNCTIAGNSTMLSPPGYGGGVYNYWATMRQINCTITDNTSVYGGGVCNYSSGTMAQTNCTIANNNASFGGEIYSSNSSLSTKNSIIIGDVAPPSYCFSVGNNIFSNSYACSRPSDRIGVTAAMLHLDSLAYNGGYTKTFALLAGSIAINAGDTSKAPITDQRGMPRVCKVDVGAFEYQTNLSSNSTTNLSICSSSLPYNWNGLLCNAAGSYHKTIAWGNIFHCDSDITLNLSVKPTPIVSFTHAGAELYADAGFVSYQWNLNGSPISGATSQKHVALTNGNYTVLATDTNGCTGTSVATPINEVGIETIFSSDFNVALYPNPIEDVLTIETNSKDIINAEIYNLHGQQIVTYKFIRSITVGMSSLSAGIYNMILSDKAGNRLYKRIVKKQTL
ncbi:MAG: T9SS type A sorting domain-containing protein [Chitinophagales bacterium]|nr:T9SS type A sorting domain-containing protein [Chitinophagales bacterium]